MKSTPRIFSLNQTTLSPRLATFEKQNYVWHSILPPFKGVKKIKDVEGIEEIEEIERSRD